MLINLKPHRVFYLLLFCLLIIACKKGKTGPETFKAVVYPKGQPEGAPITKTIDGSGGSLTSTDNRITISVPQGALATATTVSIQPISNTLPASAGTSYRLLPEGVNFSKPVTITFRYTDNEIQNSSADVLALAYQDQEGYWHKMKKSVVDKVAKTISVETTHFSDWAILEEYYIVAETNPVKPGASSNLHLKWLSGEDGDDYLLNPKIGASFDAPLQENETVTWKLLAGNGTVQSAGPAKAVYKAPASISGPNPVTVAATWKPKRTGYPGEVIFFSKISLMDEGMTVTLDGTPYVLENVRGFYSGGILIVTGHKKGSPAETVVLTISGVGLGTYPYGLPSQANRVQLQISIGAPNPGEGFLSYYNQCNPAATIHSPNYTTITLSDQNGRYVEGQFTGSVYHKPHCSSTLVERTIDGVFRLTYL